MSLYNQKGIVSLIVLSVVATVLMGGAGVAVIADTAKPGDLLYGIDQKVEQAQIALTLGDVRKDRMRISIAQERLLEIDQLIASNERPDELIKIGVASLETHLSSVKTPESHKNFQELSEKRQRIAERVDDMFNQHIKRFETQKAELQKKLDQTTDDQAATTNIQKQIEATDKRIQQQEEVRHKIGTNLERRTEELREKTQEIKEKLQDQTRIRP